jgi:hypothetical protein
VLLLVEVHCLFKIKTWLAVSTKLKAVDEHDVCTYTGLRALIGISVLVSVVNLASFSNCFVFFPKYKISYVVMEWYFTLVLLVVSGLRNWTSRQNEVDLAVSILLPLYCLSLPF